MFFRRNVPNPTGKCNDHSIYLTNVTNSSIGTRTHGPFTFENHEAQRGSTYTYEEPRSINRIHEDPSSGLVLSSGRTNRGEYDNQMNDVTYDEVGLEFKYSRSEKNNDGEYVRMDANASVS